MKTSEKICEVHDSRLRPWGQTSGALSNQRSGSMGAQNFLSAFYVVHSRLRSSIHTPSVGWKVTFYTFSLETIQPASVTLRKRDVMTRCEYTGTNPKETDLGSLYTRGLYVVDGFPSRWADDVHLPVAEVTLPLCSLVRGRRRFLWVHSSDISCMIEYKERVFC